MTQKPSVPPMRVEKVVPDLSKGGVKRKLAGCSFQPVDNGFLVNVNYIVEHPNGQVQQDRPEVLVYEKKEDLEDKLAKLLKMV